MLMINISINGEHLLYVEAIARLLHEEPEFNIHLLNVKTLSPSIQSKQDVFVYCANGYSNSLIKEIQKLHRIDPDIKKVLIISMAHRHFLEKLFDTGINSIISYKASAEELTQAVKYASLKQQFLSADLSKMVIKSKYPSCFNSLSQRELEITYLLANGMSVKRVSAELDISPKTVNTYRYRIFSKLVIAHDVDLFKRVSQEAAYMLNG